MITPRHAHALALTQGKVYAFGGKHFGNHALFEWESYSIYENRWNALPALPSPLSWAFAVVHGEEIWVSGREERLSAYNYMNNCHRIINITLPKNTPFNIKRSKSVMWGKTLLVFTNGCTKWVEAYRLNFENLELPTYSQLAGLKKSLT